MTENFTFIWLSSSNCLKSFQNRGMKLFKISLCALAIKVACKLLNHVDLKEFKIVNLGWQKI